MAKNKKKLTREQREAIDNKIVLATAISLISAIALLYLYRYMTSAYSAATRNFVVFLMWVGTAGVAFSLVMYFWKKEKRFLFLIPYFAAGSFFCLVITYNIFRFILNPMGIETNTKFNFMFVYACLAVYLVATYIYYGLKLRRK